ncbi:hypothetical protein C805_00038 [Eubacterium sp. 14-2]|uniref:hypothetical protein n=1 Tax=Eubacterium sp. 14-2 TaxID=1235790 RepID=UPI000335DB41|nr:hypothetical protein [Eubacterium sp. 14-2]EOT29455.1 hypothetical protein C805_00038 [Eubacterium sp. 14-2]
MEELANIGKMISIFVIGIFYCTGWVATGAFLDKKNDDTRVKIFSIIWMIIHGFAFVGFLIWSWIGV